ncbi:hypothetical protein ACEK07_22050 [Alcanivoracaceae bacterium MT1]
MDINPSATFLGVLVFFVFFMRLLRVVYVRGKPDPDAISTVWSAALVPATLTAAALITEMLLVKVYPVWGRWIVLGQALTALGGAIWAMERGRHQVLRRRMKSKDQQ